MTNIGPEGDFNPKDPQAPRLVRSGANVRLVGIVSFVAGIGVSAIIVFVFFILIPKFSQTSYATRCFRIYKHGCAGWRG